jgi:23S rRNA (adenine1618-N6)-methyltransferase
LKHNNQLDFSDPASVVQLTKALLKLDFGLEIDLSEQRLCPPVSTRARSRMIDPGGKLLNGDASAGAKSP